MSNLFNVRYEVWYYGSFDSSVPSELIAVKDTLDEAWQVIRNSEYPTYRCHIEVKAGDVFICEWIFNPPTGWWPVAFMCDGVNMIDKYGLHEVWHKS